MDDPAAMTPADLAQACARAMWRNDHASQGLGMELVHVAPGEATVAMTLTRAMTNGQGNAHGGFLFALADSAFAFACNTYNQMTVAQHCSVTYVAPGTLGDRLTATAREVTRKGRSGIYDVRVTRDDDGATIAEFRGHSRTIDRTFLPAAPGDAG